MYETVDFLRWEEAQEAADGFAAETALSLFLLPVASGRDVELLRHKFLRVGILDPIFIDFSADEMIQVCVRFFHLYPFLSSTIFSLTRYKEILSVGKESCYDLYLSIGFII